LFVCSEDFLLAFDSSFDGLCGAHSTSMLRTSLAAIS
jgi:hypothetical protein